MNDRRELSIEYLPYPPLDCVWRLEENSPSSGVYTLYLVDTLSEREYAKLVANLNNRFLVTAADILIEEYVSYNRAEALEEGPLYLVPARD